MVNVFLVSWAEFLGNFKSQEFLSHFSLSLEINYTRKELNHDNENEWHNVCVCVCVYSYTLNKLLFFKVDTLIWMRKDSVRVRGWESEQGYRDKWFTAVTCCNRNSVFSPAKEREGSALWPWRVIIDTSRRFIIDISLPVSWWNQLIHSRNHLRPIVHSNSCDTFIWGREGRQRGEKCCTETQSMLIGRISQSTRMKVLRYEWNRMSERARKLFDCMSHDMCMFKCLSGGIFRTARASALLTPRGAYKLIFAFFRSFFFIFTPVDRSS